MINGPMDIGTDHSHFLYGGFLKTRIFFHWAYIHRSISPYIIHASRSRSRPLYNSIWPTDLRILHVDSTHRVHQTASGLSFDLWILPVLISDFPSLVSVASLFSFVYSVQDGILISSLNTHGCDMFFQNPATCHLVIRPFYIKVSGVTGYCIRNGANV
jgi:hypothetical protein